MSGKERRKTPVLRAYELMKETLFRKTFVLAVHMIWFAVYGLFWLLLLPTETEAGEFIYLWGGFFLPLALSLGEVETPRPRRVTSAPRNTPNVTCWDP